MKYSWPSKHITQMGRVLTLRLVVDRIRVLALVTLINLQELTVSEEVPDQESVLLAFQPALLGRKEAGAGDGVFLQLEAVLQVDVVCQLLRLLSESLQCEILAGLLSL